MKVKFKQKAILALIGICACFAPNLVLQTCAMEDKKNDEVTKNSGSLIEEGNASYLFDLEEKNKEFALNYDVFDKQKSNEKSTTVVDYENLTKPKQTMSTKDSDEGLLEYNGLLKDGCFDLKPIGFLTGDNQINDVNKNKNKQTSYEKEKQKQKENELKQMDVIVDPKTNECFYDVEDNDLDSDIINFDLYLDKDRKYKRNTVAVEFKERTGYDLPEDAVVFDFQKLKEYANQKHEEERVALESLILILKYVKEYSDIKKKFEEKSIYCNKTFGEIFEEVFGKSCDKQLEETFNKCKEKTKNLEESIPNAIEITNKSIKEVKDFFDEENLGFMLNFCQKYTSSVGPLSDWFCFGKLFKRSNKCILKGGKETKNNSDIWDYDKAFKIDLNFLNKVTSKLLYNWFTTKVCGKKTNVDINLDIFGTNVGVFDVDYDFDDYVRQFNSSIKYTSSDAGMWFLDKHLNVHLFYDMGNSGDLIYIGGLDIEGKKVIYDVEAASECFFKYESNDTEEGCFDKQEALLELECSTDSSEELV